METHDAYMEEIESEQYLSFKFEDTVMRIPLTKDEPNEIKKVFNDLILRLKKGPLNFAMKEIEDGDLFYYVAKEYVTQLNTELSEVYKELVAYGLLDQR